MKRAIIIIALFTSGAHSALSYAQAQCQAFVSANEHALKRISYETFSNGLGDNSIPRATMREMEINNQLQLININTQIMIQSKCALPTTPMDIGTFAGPAIACAAARMKLPGATSLPECDLNRWERSKPKAE